MDRRNESEYNSSDDEDLSTIQRKLRRNEIEKHLQISCDELIPLLEDSEFDEQCSEIADALSTPPATGESSTSGNGLSTPSGLPSKSQSAELSIESPPNDNNQSTPGPTGSPSAYGDNLPIPVPTGPPSVNDDAPTTPLPNESPSANDDTQTTPLPNESPSGSSAHDDTPTTPLPTGSPAHDDHTPSTPVHMPARPPSLNDNTPSNSVPIEPPTNDDASSTPIPSRYSSANNDSSLTPVPENVNALLTSVPIESFPTVLSCPQVAESPPAHSGQALHLILHQIMSALSKLQNDVNKIENNMQQMIAGQKALRESMKYLYSVMKPHINHPEQNINMPGNIPTTNPRPAQPPSSATTSTPRRPAPSVTPVYIAGPEAGTYLLGGEESLIRDVVEYQGAVRNVASRAASKPEAMGRMLCSLLMRREFSDRELADKNITGKTRDPQTKKMIEIPKLNEKVIQAIFRQAKIQFPEFRDLCTDPKSQTVQLLTDTCKHIRKKLSTLQ